MTMPTKSPIYLCGITVPYGDTRRTNREWLFQNVTCMAKPDRMSVGQATSVANDVLWPNGQVLNYSFFGGTPNQQKKVRDTIVEWTWYANIHFKESTPNNSKATLRIAFDPNKGSWSYVGSTAETCPANEPTINLGLIGDSNNTTKKERGVILHQFGHVLGLKHEHENPALSGAIRLKEKEIIEYYSKTQGLNERTVRKVMLDLYLKETLSNYGRFDPMSIMIFSIPGYMNEGGVDIGYGATELSMSDKAFIVCMYPRPEAHPQAPQWTPSFAMVAAGSSSEAIGLYNSTEDVYEKRSHFIVDIIKQRIADLKRTKQTEQLHQAPLTQSMQGEVKSTAPTTDLADTEAIDELIRQLDLLPQFPQQQHAPKNLQPTSASTSTATTVDPVQRALDVSHHAEMVQKGVLGLLLTIAPMVLLAPNIPVPGSNQVAHAVLDPNNLTIENPVVQFGLRTFFAKLASNPIVKDVMTGAVGLVGDTVTDLIKGPTAEPQHAPLGDALGRVVNGLLANQYFKHSVTTMVGTAVGTMTYDEFQKFKLSPEQAVKTDDEIEFQSRMDKTATKLWKESGPDGSNKILELLEKMADRAEKSKK